MLDDPLVPQKPVIDEPPPFLGTWPRVYALVVVALITYITLFWFFTKAFRP